MKPSEPEPTSKAIPWPKVFLLSLVLKKGIRSRIEKFQVIRKYLAQLGRESELKEMCEVEPTVVHIFKSLVNIRNDATTDAQAQKWAKLPSKTKKSILDKWEQKATNE